MPSYDGFRVFGGELGRKDAYVDVVVDSIAYDGTITVIEDGGSETWDVDPDDISDLRDRDLLVGSSEVPVPTHQIWDTLISISDLRKNNDFNNVVDQRLEDGARNIFQAVIEYGQ